MKALDLIERVMENPTLYRLWQAPFAEMKLAPVLARNDLRKVRRVLDVGCGPGTNTAHFAGTEYLGIDWNPRYVETARRRTGRDFLVADVTTFSVAPHERFDFILLNSLLHHLDTPDATRLLSHLATLLSDDGHLHIVEMIMPDHASVARFLARWDRGRYIRPLAEWRRMIDPLLETIDSVEYPLGAFGTTLWPTVYLKARAGPGRGPEPA
jgi:SAM-dependent methyltransferase